MDRTLEPEMLDGLPPDHPEALRNRRDLRLTNIVMGNYTWFRRTLSPRIARHESILELGAGTGELGIRLARDGLRVDGLDLWPRPAAWPADAAWHRTDVRAFRDWSQYPVVIANLLLHQFSEVDLHALGEQLQHCRLIVACEPTRRRLSQVAYRAIAPLFGANRVTLHDAHVSISAGFRGDELPRVLGLAADRWSASVHQTWLGAYRLVAERR